MTTANGILDASALADIVTAAPSTAWAQAISPRQKVIVILGSSTGFGFGASTYANSWGGLLEAALKAIDPAWQVINSSESGNATQWALDNYDEKVAKYRPAFVIHCTSIINEPGQVDQATYQAGMQSFLDNRRKLVEKDKAIGAQTIMASNYPNNNWSSVQYQLALLANAVMEQWRDVRLIDWMSDADDGTGKFKSSPTITPDGTHGNDLMHSFYFNALPLEWFLKGATGVIDEGPEASWEVTTTSRRLAVTLQSASKSWTMWGRFQSKSGVTVGTILMGAMVYGTNSPIRVRAPSTVLDLTDSTSTLATSSVNITTDFTTHDVAISYNGLTNKISLVIDGVIVGTEATAAAFSNQASLFGFLSKASDGSFTMVGMTIGKHAIWRTAKSVAALLALKTVKRLPSSSLAYLGMCNVPPGQIGGNAAPTSIYPIIDGGSGWSQKAAI